MSALTVADDYEYVERLLSENDLPTTDLDASDVELFVFSVDDERVGCGGLEVYCDHALLRSVVVEDEHRGNSYGQSLCEGLLDRAQNQGVREVYLLTTTAADFFERLDFERIDPTSVPDSIQDTTEFAELCPDSAVCMRRRLE